MLSITRFHNSVLVIFYALFPSATARKNNESGTNDLVNHCPIDYLPVDAAGLYRHLQEEASPGNPLGSIRLFIPRVSPLAAPFILFYLKRNGFSGCRVEVVSGGLAVRAIR